MLWGLTANCELRIANCELHMTKALANIEKSSYGTIKSIVGALKGEIFIIWSDVPSEEKGKLKDEKCSPEERLENLELMLAQVLMKLNQPGEQSSADHDKS